ncbi:MAG: hypothetical protein GYB64_12085 [Chloroflexi bacterium]|nr:hypothetical protein [Chloroflexota bacterium]
MAEQAADVLSFQEGDRVVHPSQGGGRLTQIQRLEVAGKERRYYCIDLVSGEGELMLPVGQAEEVGLRPALDDIAVLHAVLQETPEELSSNYRSREAHVSKMIGSGEIELLVQAVRDLSWHAHLKNLTNTDARLKSEAQKLIASELALCLGVDFDEAQNRLSELVSKAINAHAEDEPVN